MRLLSATVLLLVALGAFAQTPSYYARIEGSVFRADNGAPILRARITLQRANERLTSRTALTDINGRFVIENISAGRYRLFVERQGFVRQFYGQQGVNPTGTVLELAAGQSLRDLVFRLLANSVISGRATDELGEPIEGARIEAHRRVCANGQTAWVRARSTTTNDLGEYRLYNLPPGNYFVSAVSTARLFPMEENFGSSGDAAEVNRRVAEVLQSQVARAVEAAQEASRPAEDSTLYGYAPVYHPDTRDPARAIPIAIEAGQERRNVDFSFSPAPIYSVRGQLVLPGGVSSRGASVMLMPAAVSLRGLFLSTAGNLSNDTGTFQFRGVIPGSYTLFANLMVRDQRYVAQIPLEVGAADVAGLQVVLLPGASVTGRVRIEGTTNPAFAPRSISVMMESLDPSSRNASSSPVSATGEFRFRNVAPGGYRIRIPNLAENLYLRAAILGTEDVVDRDLRIHPGVSIPMLELVLSPDGGTIEGQVLTGESLPAGGATVLAVPDRARGRSDLARTVTTDQAGRFVISGLAPGGYKLFAWVEVDPEVCLDETFLAPVQNRAVAVTVSARQAAHAELRTLP